MLKRFASVQRLVAMMVACLGILAFSITSADANSTAWGCSHCGSISACEDGEEPYGYFGCYINENSWPICRVYGSYCDTSGGGGGGGCTGAFCDEQPQ